MTVNGKQNVELIRDLADSVEAHGLYTQADLIAYSLLVDDAMGDEWACKQAKTKMQEYKRDVVGFVKYMRDIASEMEGALNTQEVAK